MSVGVSPNEMRRAGTKFLGSDRYLVAKPVPGGQRQRIAAPKLPRIKPIEVFLGLQQTHLLVGDGDCLGAVRGFQSGTGLLCLAAFDGLANLSVHDWDSPGEVGSIRYPATEPAARQPRCRRERGAVHPRDHPQHAVLLLAA